jgi:hypothetical protein
MQISRRPRQGATSSPGYATGDICPMSFNGDAKADRPQLHSLDRMRITRRAQQAVRTFHPVDLHSVEPLVVWSYNTVSEPRCRNCFTNRFTCVLSRVVIQ